MKKFCVFLAVILCFAMLACGSNPAERHTDIPLRDIAAEMMGTQTTEDEPIRLTAQTLMIRYGIDVAVVDEVEALLFSEGIFPSEWVMLHAADEAAADSIAEMLDIYIDSLRDQTRDYSPESYRIAEECTVLRDGLYCAMFFDSERETLERTFLSHIMDGAYLPPEPSEDDAAEPELAEDPAAEEVLPADAEPEEEISQEETKKYGLVPAGERADDSWFDDAVFIGNSVGGNLNNYVTRARARDNPNLFGKMEFYTVGKSSAYSFANGYAPLPVKHGCYITPEQAVEETGATKAYIYVCNNDLISMKRSIEDTLGSLLQIANNIRERCPGTDIYIPSMMPRSAYRDNYTFNDEVIREFNAQLLRMCEENEMYYIECYDSVATADGRLDDSLCVENAEGGIHLNEAGCAVWTEVLYTHTVG